MNEDLILESMNKLIDFYKTELEKYRNLYFKEKEKYDLLLFHVQQQDFDDFEYRGIKIKDLYEKYIEK